MTRCRHAWWPEIVLLPLTILALLFLFGCTPPPEWSSDILHPRIAEVPAPDPLLCLPIEVETEKGMVKGSGIPISPYEVLTATHVIQKEIPRLLGRSLYLPELEGETRVAVFGVHLVVGSPDDLTAATVRLTVEDKRRLRFARWLERGVDRPGVAYILRPDAVHEVEIVDRGRQEFLGFRPVPGMSGSGVIQRIDGRWRVVGVVRSKRCDGCPICAIYLVDRTLERWHCHCPPGGFYSRAIEPWERVPQRLEPMEKEAPRVH